ncbi:MAG: hypothetical protein ACJAQT_000042 [Akkermansiaceae bacterium]
MEHGIGFELVLAPKLFARDRIETGEHATGTKRHNLALGHRRRTARARKAVGGTTGAFDFESVDPKFFPARRFETEGDFVIVLAGKT